MATTISGTSGVTYPSGGVDNVAGAGVGTTDTQTLTNKTLITPNINSAPFATVSGTAPLYGCRAWANWDGTAASPITPRASGNISSITKNSSGNYTLNFTTALPDANYAGVFGCNDQGNIAVLCAGPSGGTKTTSAFQVRSQVGTATITDNALLMAAIFD
jgi:hypothetical protein